MAGTAVVVAAAGSGSRMGADKLQLPLGGRPVLVRTVEGVLAADVADLVVVAVRPGAEDLVRHRLLEPFGLAGRVLLVAGGAHRAETVALALEAVSAETGAAAGSGRRVLVHDGARPLASPSLFRRVAAAVPPGGGATAAVPLADSLHRAAAGGLLGATVAREGLWAAQTPQGFELGVLREAHAWAAAAGRAAAWSDDAGLVAGRGAPVRLVAGEATNIKLTVGGDLAVAEALLAAGSGRERRGAVEHRTGFGWDVHRLEQGLPLVLGGVRIPFDRGCLAHSDGDVLAHALMDAILGAAGLRDIGVHFPPDEPALAGADSLLLLRRTGSLVAAAGWSLENADATVVAQRPRLAPHVPAMVTALAEALGVDPGRINVKAATAEGLGAVGDGRAIEAHAVALLARRQGAAAGGAPGTPVPSFDTTIPSA